MFTGLVETIATVRALERRGPQAKLRLSVRLDDLALGESISVNGVCLTVTAFQDDHFEADVSAETLAVTTLGKLSVGKRVNIERSVRLGARMGGHVVLGHVDDVGQVRQLAAVGAAKRLEVEAPAHLQRYLAPKGSVCIEGVSLTINELASSRSFAVMLVPHTLAATTLESLAVGDAVNLEADVLARYVARQLDYASSSCAAPQGASRGGDAAAHAERDKAIMSKLAQGGFLG